MLSSTSIARVGPNLVSVCDQERSNSGLYVGWQRGIDSTMRFAQVAAIATMMVNVLPNQHKELEANRGLQMQLVMHVIDNYRWIQSMEDFVRDVVSSAGRLRLCHIHWILEERDPFRHSNTLMIVAETGLWQTLSPLRAD